MSSFPAAASLARALTMLDRARASGELEASSREGRATLAVREGRVVAIEAPTVSAPRLGRLLVEGGLGATELERALDARAPGVRMGDAVVRAGLAGQGAVSHALRLQMRARARALAAWSSIELRFERCAPRAAAHAEPVRVGDLMIGAMRDALAPREVADVRAVLGVGSLVLTPLGESLLDGAPLWPDEQAIASLLRRPTPLGQLERAASGSARALRLLLGLRLLEAVAPPAPASLSLLARKSRQMLGGASAEALLDLPRGARPDEARLAWRRLSARLHPDRFANGVPAPLQHLSNEVSSALNGAARQLRAAR